MLGSSSNIELRNLPSTMSVDDSGNPRQPPGAFYIVIDEAITEVDDDGTVYTAYGFLVMWRGNQSGGYRRFGEFRALSKALTDAAALPNIRFPLWPFPPSSWRLSPDVIETRARGLQSYLTSALKESATRGTMPLELTRFLRLPAEEGDDEPDPIMAHAGSASSSSRRDPQRVTIETDDGDNDEEELVHSTLNRMKRHAAALRLLQVRLERAVRPASTLEDEAPYEDFGQPVSSLASQLAPPLDHIDDLLGKLILTHHATDGAPAPVGEAGLEPTRQHAPRGGAGGGASGAPSPPAEPPSLMERVMPASLLARLGVASASAPPDGTALRATGTLKIAQTSDMDLSDRDAGM